MSVSDLQFRNASGTFQSIFPISVSQGGTGATSATTARSNLGITLPNLGANDYVVASGVSGNWGYVKWNSGVALCFATIGQNFPQNGLYITGWYYKDGSIISYPFAFTSAPAYFVGKITHDNSAIITTASVGTTTQTPKTRIISASTGTATETITMLAIGRWK